MKLLDCTLRDGGFKNDFNWDFEFAKNYYALLTEFKVPYIELGYWKQTSKSKNPFYNLDFKDVEKITGDTNNRNCVIIIDYHYCSKNLDIYPKKNNSNISMIRLTARKEDINDAINFAKDLSNKTQIDLSFQIINSTNYSQQELDIVVKKLIESNFLYIYFADSHGNLNLQNDFWIFEQSINNLKSNGKKIGFHFHNHAGRALMNYHFIIDKGIEITDTSINGLGKGGGNLKLEDVIINENIVKLLNFIKTNHSHLGYNNLENLYYIISGRMSVTDNYAKQAYKNKISFKRFYEFCFHLRNFEKDNFNSKLLDDIKF